MVRCTYLAVLTDGSHRTGTGMFATTADFKRHVAAELRSFADMVERFVYACGREMQEYTRREVAEVYGI